MLSTVVVSIFSPAVLDERGAVVLFHTKTLIQGILGCGQTYDAVLPACPNLNHAPGRNNAMCGHSYTPGHPFFIGGGFTMTCQCIRRRSWTPFRSKL